jgi:sulfatase maturation enzyme AslB (radical SAM superfamily)
MTLAPNNISYLYDSILNLMDLGYTEINLNCVYESGWDSKHAKIMYNDLKKIADYILNNDLYNKIYISLFEENYFTPINPSENNNWCGGVADTSVAINYEGNMYPCIRYMEHSLNKKQEPIIFGDVFSGYLSTSKYKQNYLKVSNITRRS